jgi:hypothetical protein
MLVCPPWRAAVTLTAEPSVSNQTAATATPPLSARLMPVNTADRISKITVLVISRFLISDSLMIGDCWVLINRASYVEFPINHRITDQQSQTNQQSQIGNQQ